MIHWNSKLAFNEPKRKFNRIERAIPKYSFLKEYVSIDKFRAHFVSHGGFSSL